MIPTWTALELPVEVLKTTYPCVLDRVCCKPHRFLRFLDLMGKRQVYQILYAHGMERYLRAW